jgi:hypothetical protein
MTVTRRYLVEAEHAFLHFYTEHHVLPVSVTSISEPGDVMNVLRIDTHEVDPDAIRMGLRGQPVIAVIAGVGSRQPIEWSSVLFAESGSHILCIALKNGMYFYSEPIQYCECVERHDAPPSLPAEDIKEIVEAKRKIEKAALLSRRPSMRVPLEPVELPSAILKNEP